ncbi:putative DNA-binding transcriptional regulator AlpA [Labrenzia sp. EL_159]|nr:putative DNA-binding transcriptional regulator AlpA [Labrenzia sp. EL_162]MBG6193111.1 putative DNA-binding transcriptional regulator AlpA [Labrenzia sp. EL_159]
MYDERNAVIDFHQLAKIVPLSRSQIWRLEKEGRFPARIKIGRRKVAWRYSEIIDWIERAQ